MINTVDVLKNLESSVLSHDQVLLERSVKTALEIRVTGVAIRQAILNGLDQVRKRLLSNESSLPELLISLDVAAAGLNRLSAAGVCSSEENPVSVVIGVVEGDPHDLGKNIIAMIYRSFGFCVYDLGAQVPAELFAATVREKNANILALSAMMSTTMMQMPGIIKEVRAVSPGTLILVGGAPLDETLAASFGADGYAQSAVTVLETTESLLKKNREPIR